MVSGADANSDAATKEEAESQRDRRNAATRPLTGRTKLGTGDTPCCLECATALNRWHETKDRGRINIMA